MTKQRNLPALLTILLIPVIALLLNLPIVETLWRHSFDDGSYSHAFLIPIIFIYICYFLYQHNDLHLRESLHPVALGLFLFSCLLFFINTRAQISLGYWISHVFLMTTSTLMLFKYHWKVILPPAYLIFIYPFWGIFTGFLQQLSTIVVSNFMSLTPIPTYVENEFITIPAGTFEIANGCSGLRYLISVLAISVLYAFFNLRQTKQIFLFFSVAIIGALITNWIRIAIIILVGHFTDMQSSLIEDHNMFGWYIFIPFVYFLFKYGDRLYFSQKDEEINKKETSRLSLQAASATLAGLILTSTTFSASFNNTNTELESTTTFEPDIHFYSTVETDIKPQQASQLIRHTYHFDGSQLDGKPTYFNNKYIPDDWTEIENEVISDWQIIKLEKKNQNALIAYSYQIDGVRTASRGQFKKLRIKKALTGNRQTQLHWMGIICQSDCQQEKLYLQSEQ
jgi:exosortase